MAKVTSKFTINKKILDFLSNSDKDQIGKEVIDEIKSSILRGVSPVRGFGRFEAYKNPKSYPAKKKPKTPVNLKLTGRMLDSLDYKIKKNTLEIYLKNEPDYAIVHQEGSDKVPRRTFLPRSGEEFVISIMTKIKQMIADSLKRYLNSK